MVESDRKTSSKRPYAGKRGPNKKAKIDSASFTVPEFKVLMKNSASVFLGKLYFIVMLEQT